MFRFSPPKAENIGFGGKGVCCFQQDLSARRGVPGVAGDGCIKWFLAVGRGFVSLERFCLLIY